MTSNISLNNNKEIILFLSQKFPQCFSIKGQAKPLKVGIFQDLIVTLNLNDESNEFGLSKTKLRQALRAYTSNWRYLYAMRPAAKRVDLQGKPVEEVSNEDAQFAKKELEASKKRASEFQKLSPNALNSEKANPTKYVESVASTPATSTANLHQDIQFKVGDTVKLKMGSQMISAVIVSIEKELARVKIDSGMELAVSIQNLEVPV